MKNKSFWLMLSALVCMSIYLFVSAPPPLADHQQKQTIPVEQMFTLLQAENSLVRAMWTQEIVGDGAKVGLKFDEHWRDDALDAGPLPALFLRETAKSLEKSRLRVSLFLGSDYPISPDNRFEGVQLDKLLIVRQLRQPQFFYIPDTRLYAGMFADVAVAQACVECHNKHEQSPKNDWRLNDVMGGSTWLYPARTVALEELVAAVTVLHQGFREAYEAYLEKVKTFADPPLIGERWPRDGYYLPDAETFMQEILKRTSAHTVVLLGSLVDPGYGSQAFGHVSDR